MNTIQFYSVEPNALIKEIAENVKTELLAELTKIFASVPKNKEVIVYCKTGTTAGFVYFVLKSVLNYPNVKVYEGAYLDWVRK